MRLLGDVAATCSSEIAVRCVEQRVQGHRQTLRIPIDAEIESAKAPPVDAGFMFPLEVLNPRLNPAYHHRHSHCGDCAGVEVSSIPVAMFTRAKRWRPRSYSTGLTASCRSIDGGNINYCPCLQPSRDLGIPQNGNLDLEIYRRFLSVPGGNSCCSHPFHAWQTRQARFYIRI